MAISPFIANSLDFSPSMQPSDVLVHCLVKKNSFDVKHEGLNGFPKAEEETRYLIEFMWEASMGKVTSNIYIYSLDPHILERVKKLHTEKNASPDQILSVYSNVSTPSNSTMSNLASAVVITKEYLEKIQPTSTK